VRPIRREPEPLPPVIYPDYDLQSLIVGQPAQTVEVLPPASARERIRRPMRLEGQVRSQLEFPARVCR
jgi:hypothetical protein